MIPKLSAFVFCRLAILILLSGGVITPERLLADDFRPLLEAAVRDGKSEVTIPPGVYRLAPVGGNTHVVVARATNLNITADGVTLICEKLTRALTFDHCKNVTLRGLTVDYDPLPFTQGTVIRVADDLASIDIHLHAGYPRAAYSRIDLCDAATRTRKRGMPFLWGTRAEMLDADTVRVSLKDIGKAASIGDLASLNTGPTGHGSPHGICIDFCEGMVFENVTLCSAPGFGIFEQDGEGGMRYTHCRVIPGPMPVGATEERLLSSSWDAMQSSTIRRGPLVENCEIRDAGDDSWSVQSNDYVVLAIDGPSVVIGYRNPYCSGPEIGDRLVKSLGSESVRLTARLPVAMEKANLSDDVRRKLREAPSWSAWKVGPKALLIQVEGTLPLAVGDAVYDPDRQGNGFIFRNNRLNSPGRILIKAGDGLIENNEVIAGHAGVTVCPELPASGAAGIENLVIRGNHFTGTGYFCPSWDSSQAGCISITASADHQRFQDAGLFRNIVIERNRFDDINGPGIVATSIRGLKIVDNVFCRMMQTKFGGTGGAYGIDPGALIWLAQSQEIGLSGNRVFEPGAFFKAAVLGKDNDPATLEFLRGGTRILTGETCPTDEKK